MKLLLVLLFPFFLGSFTSDTTPSTEPSVDETIRVRICWKGPKGNRTCITVSGIQGIRTPDKDIFGSAFMAADGSGMLLDLSGTNVKSFTLAENAKIETCGSSLGLKMGTEIDVVNGYAMLK